MAQKPLWDTIVINYGWFIVPEALECISEALLLQKDSAPPPFYIYNHPFILVRLWNQHSQGELIKFYSTISQWRSFLSVDWEKISFLKT